MELIKVKDIAKKGFRSKYSSTYLLAKAVDLDVLPITDEEKIHFTSPTFAEIVDDLTSKFQVRKMLDLFCGSGALSKIALLNKTPKVKCVDVFTKAAVINLCEFEDKVEIVEGNILKMDFDERFDFVTIDSPSVLLMDVVGELLPKIKSNLITLYYGGKGELERDERIEKQLQGLFENVFFIRYPLKYACCASTKVGKEYVNYLRKRF